MGQLPHRLRRLLWVICLNAAMLGLEASVQRFSGTTKLLWLVEPRINKAPDSQFGPYAYRSNAAQYLNLVWPVSLGFWWLLQREARRNWRQHSRIGGSAHVVLLPTTIVTAASPIVSTSRGGALVAAVGMIIAMVLLVIANRHGHWWWRLGIFGVVLASLGLGGYLGWDTLEPRLKKVFSDDAGGRLPIYRNARQIASDFPWYGTGPGTFASVYQLYRQSSEDIWYSEAHDDWLELRITFGWTGFALVITLLALLAVYPFLGTGIATPRLFIALLGLALAGCLVHAKGDFPFQVPSILWLFLVLGSVGFCLTWSTDRR